MSRKHTIPGVDETALSELARQFPSHEIPPPPPPPPLSQDPVSRPSEPAPARARSGGATVAVLFSILALIVALFPLAAPFFRAELSRLVPDPVVLDSMLAGRPSLERGLAREATERTAQERKVADTLAQLELELKRTSGRVGAIEAVGGAGFDVAAQRVEAAEAAVGAAVDRVSMFETQLGEMRGVMDTLSPAERVSAIETQLGEVRGTIGTLSSAERVSAVEKQLGEVRGEISALSPAVEAKLTEMEQRALSAVEEKTGAVNRTAASAVEQAARAEAAATATGQKVAQVEQGFAELQQFNRTSVRLFLIALHLRTAVQTPAAFSREVTAVRGLIGSNPEAVNALSVLEQNANGVRTLSDLRDTFAAGPAQQIKALAAGLDPSWTSRLTALVSGPQMPRAGEGERVWQVVTQAEQALRQGNLAAAINHIDRFDGAAGGLVTEWLRDAKARLAVENAAAQLSIYALSQLVGGS